MSKKLPVIKSKQRLGGLLLLALAIVIAAALIGSGDKPKRTVPPPDSVKNAYSTLTLIDVYKLLGKITYSEASGKKAGSSKDLEVSSVTYKTVEPKPEIKGYVAKLVVKAPKTEDGAHSNHESFDDLPGGAESVDGYGDAAYWDPETGTLNILNKETWYVITYGKSKAADRKLAEAKQVADLFKAQLKN